MVRKYAEINGQRIVGVYVARDEGDGLPRAVERVWKILRESFEGAFALAVSIRPLWTLNVHLSLSCLPRRSTMINWRLGNRPIS